MINYRNINDNKVAFKKLIDFDFGRADYNEDIVINCHDGQRKLMYTVIEFYTELSKHFDLNDLLVVYIGSAGGFHAPIIFDMFPQLKYYFVDPAPFFIKHKIVNTDRLVLANDFYDDNYYKKIKEFNKENRKIVFVSDIRVDPNEKDVMRDMLNQQKWCIQLNSIAYLFKFRLPWDREHKIFKYLKGNIYRQIYSPRKSTETRLMGIRTHDEPFMFVYYNVTDYDNAMFYYNYKVRRSKTEFLNSSEMKYHILGYDDSYESVTEYHLVYNYLKDFNKTMYDNTKFKSSTLEQKTIILLQDINKRLIKLTNKPLVDCKYKMYLKRRKQIKNNPKFSKVYSSFKDETKLYREQLVSSLKKQLEFLEESKSNPKKRILEIKDYDEQIKRGQGILVKIQQ